MKYLVVLMSLFLFSCGGSSNSSGSEDEVFAEESGTEEVVAEESGLETESVVQIEYFGQDGNLYKPVSDETASGGGNMVVLLSSKYTEQFDSCEVLLTNGEIAQLICINDQPWTQIPYSCFSNGNRQTWRASFNCNEVAEIKITCRDGEDEYIFTVPDNALGHVCTRFG